MENFVFFYFKFRNLKNVTKFISECTALNKEKFHKFSMVMRIEAHSLAHLYTPNIINPLHVLKILYMAYNFSLVFSWYFHLQYAADINLNDNFLRGATYARSCFSHIYKESSSFLQEINRYYHEVPAITPYLVLLVLF